MPTPTTKTLSLPGPRGAAGALLVGCVEIGRAALAPCKERESHWLGSRSILSLGVRRLGKDRRSSV